MKGSEDWRGDVEAVRRAATAKGRARSGYFSIEGTRLHERALRAGWHVESAVMSRSFHKAISPRFQALLHDLEQLGCKLVAVPDEVMVKLSDGRDLGAIIGLLRKPSPPILADVVTGVTDGMPLLLVAVNVKDPGNVGAPVSYTHLTLPTTGSLWCVGWGGGG